MNRDIAAFCEERGDRDYRPMWVGGTLLVHKVSETHPELVRALIDAEIRRAA